MSEELDRMLRDASQVAGLQSTVSVALASLGDGPEEIADSLAEDGVTGERYKPDSCPVALWLVENLPVEEGLRVRVDQQDVLVETGSTKLQIPSPSPIAQFVASFDSGDFPELEGRRPRVVQLGGVGDFYTSVDETDNEEDEDL